MTGVPEGDGTGGASPAGGLPEVWGGIECTVNRVGERVFDQLKRSGHDRRREDVERIAALGVSAVRYPALWERVAPRGLDHADWRLTDESLPTLRDLSVRPIVGLLHHGSGPRATSLVDPGMAPAFAAYARAVAERYPWIQEWTPVNEPLTTARFSGLYGHWYPHGRDDRTFVRALLEQCRATVLAMRAIREVIPDAKLIQTEDAGRTYATPRMQYQADFENLRRWLSIDLLAGRVDRDHPLDRFLREQGALEAELASFLERPCPPDVLGLNYYLTSDRVLDERLALYPPTSHGGNGRDAYADVEAARARPEGILGHEEVLRAAYERYKIPVAITETHLGSTREEQLRWLSEAWEAAGAARRGGVDVRAVTVWSLFGAFDWQVLVTRRTGHYEPGAFDVRAPRPRETAIGAMTRALALEGRYESPALAGEGWWRRTHPILHGEPRARPAGGDVRPAPPILIAGAGGTLGRAFGRICERRGLAYRLLWRCDMDIADGASVRRALEEHRPWAIVNAAGFAQAERAERDAARCFRENADGPAVLAAACAGAGVRLVTFSTDLVFDGDRARPYAESHDVRPLNVFGFSKVEAERRVLAACPEALVVRAGAFFGPWDRHDFVTRSLALIAAGRPCRAVEDVIVSPTYVPDLVDACLDLLIDGERGVMHIANSTALSWASLARRAACAADLDPGRVQGERIVDMGLHASYPRYSALVSERAGRLPAIGDALRRFLGERAKAPESAQGRGRSAEAAPEGLTNPGPNVAAA